MSGADEAGRVQGGGPVEVKCSGVCDSGDARRRRREVGWRIEGWRRLGTAERSEETFQRTTAVEELFVLKDQHWRQLN